MPGISPTDDHTGEEVVVRPLISNQWQITPTTDGMKCKQEPLFMAFDEVIIMQMTRFVPNGASVIMQLWNKDTDT